MIEGGEGGCVVCKPRVVLFFMCSCCFWYCSSQAYVEHLGGEREVVVLKCGSEPEDFRNQFPVWDMRGEWRGWWVCVGVDLLIHLI